MIAASARSDSRSRHRAAAAAMAAIEDVRPEPDTSTAKHVLPSEPRWKFTFVPGRAGPLRRRASVPSSAFRPSDGQPHPVPVFVLDTQACRDPFSCSRPSRCRRTASRRSADRPREHYIIPQVGAFLSATRAPQWRDLPDPRVPIPSLPSHRHRPRSRRAGLPGLWTDAASARSWIR